MINYTNNFVFNAQLARVDQLRQSLEVAIQDVSALTCRPNVNTNSARVYVDGGEASKCHNERPLYVVYQSTTSALIQIWGTPNKKMETSRFVVSPTPNALPATTMSAKPSSNANNKPLEVNISYGKNIKNGKINDSRESGRSTVNFAPANCPRKMENSTSSLRIFTAVPPISSASPTSSIDSGVSSPSYDLLFHSSTNSLAISPPLTTIITTAPSQNSCSSITCQSQTFFDGQNNVSNRVRSASLSSTSLFCDGHSSSLISNQSSSINNKTNKKETIEEGFCNFFSSAERNSNSTSNLAKHQLFDSTSYANGGLKGILKKSLNCNCLCCMKNFQRKLSPAIGFSRSLSESGSDSINRTEFCLSNAFSGMAIHNGNKFGDLKEEVLFEDDDEFSKSSLEEHTSDNCCQHKGGNNNSDSTEASESWDEKIGELVPRKKHVSFSEHVQARIYRSNSTIVGQRKKTGRKNRMKRRRSESENIGTTEVTSQNEKPNNVDACQNCKRIKQGIRDESGNSISRRDSGIENELLEIVGSNEATPIDNPLISPNDQLCSNFSDKVNNVREALTDNEKYAFTAKRIRRLISADSALGEEDETDSNNNRDNVIADTAGEVADFN